MINQLTNNNSKKLTFHYFQESEFYEEKQEALLVKSNSEIGSSNRLMPKLISEKSEA